MRYPPPGAAVPLSPGSPTNNPPVTGPTPVVALLPGTELAYAEMTGGPITSGATVEASADTIVTAPPVFLDGATAILVEYYAPDHRLTASGQVNDIWLFDNGVSLGLLGEFINNGAAAQMRLIPRLMRRLVPAAGSHTYSVRTTVDANTIQVDGSTGGPGVKVPAFIRITKV